MSNNKNKKRLNSGLKRKDFLLNFLTTNFKEAFNLKEPKPLKVGITHNLLEQIGEDSEITRTQARIAVKIYVSRIKYLKALIEGADRIGLDGKPSGKVGKEEEDYAKAYLKMIVENAKKKAKEKSKQRVKQALNINKEKAKDSK